MGSILNNFNSNAGQNTGLSQINAAVLKNNTLPVKTITAQNNAEIKAGENLKELKKDTLTIGGKEIKKKTAIMAAIGTVLAIGGIAAGIFFALKKGHGPSLSGAEGSTLRPITGGRKPRVPDNAVVLDSMPEEIVPFDKTARKAIAKAEASVQSAKKAKEEAEILSGRVKKTIAEVQELLDTNASKTSDGRKVQIIRTEKGKIIIKEFAEDARTLKRKSTFLSGKPEFDITEFVSKSKRNIIKVNTKKETITYMGGIESSGDGVVKYHQKLDMFKGKPAFYASGCVDYNKKAGEKYVYKKVVDFEDGKMKEYRENYTHTKDKEIFGIKLEFNPNGVISVNKKDSQGRIIKNKKGKPVTKETHGEVLTGYFKDLIKNSDGSEESPLSIAFMKRPGSPGKYYMEGFKKSAEGKTKCKKSISYDRLKNTPVEYEENTQFGVGKWDKYYKFECGRWYKIPPES